MLRTSTANLFDYDPGAKLLPLGRNPRSDLAVLLADPDYPYQEGRGLYVPVQTEPGRFYYVKGAGNQEALASSKPETEWRDFPAIGHYDLDRYFFDQLPPIITPSFSPHRVRGALNLAAAINEYINADVLFKTLCRKENIKDEKQARERGLTIPIAVIDSPGISDEVNFAIQQIGRNIGKFCSAEGPSTMHYGLVILEVPSAKRIRTREHITATKEEFYREVLSSSTILQTVGRTVRHQLTAGFVSISTHYQNIYDAPDSLCPQADNNDLVPITEILAKAGAYKQATGDLLRAVVMKQLEFAPFNLLRVKDDRIQMLALTAISEILQAIAPDKWSRSRCAAMALAYLKCPHRTLSGIAEDMIEDGMVETNPQADWKKLYRANQANGYFDGAQTQVRIAIDSSLDFESRLLRYEST